MSKRVVMATRAQVAAAKLRVASDKKFGKVTPPAIVKIANAAAATMHVARHQPHVVEVSVGAQFSNAFLTFEDDPSLQAALEGPRTVTDPESIRRWLHMVDKGPAALFVVRPKPAEQ